MLILKGNNAKAGEEALREVTMLDPQGRRVDLKAERRANAHMGVDPERLKSEGVTWLMWRMTPGTASM